MLRIRLRRAGKKKQPFYRLVVADSRAPRDGAFIETIGTYNPLTQPATVTINVGSVDDLPTVLEFDPGSFVLTAFGRSNAGTVRGDATVADRYLNMFFRI